MSAEIAAMSNRLPTLAADIRRACAEADQAALTAAARAIDAGLALIEAKALCAHGQWLPFLVDAGIHERTAQRYITLAASGLQPDTVSDLGGITSALRFLRLRETAMRHLKNAEAAAIAIEQGDDADELGPLEWFFVTLEEMLAMFPPEQAKGIPA